MVAQAERVKLACCFLPPPEHAKVLLMPDLSFDVRLWHALCFAVITHAVEHCQQIYFRMETATFRRRDVGHFEPELTECVKVRLRK